MLAMDRCLSSNLFHLRCYKRCLGHSTHHPSLHRQCQHRHLHRLCLHLTGRSTPTSSASRFTRAGLRFRCCSTSLAETGMITALPINYPVSGCLPFMRPKKCVGRASLRGSWGYALQSWSLWPAGSVHPLWGLAGRRCPSRFRAHPWSSTTLFKAQTVETVVQMIQERVARFTQNLKDPWPTLRDIHPCSGLEVSGSSSPCQSWSWTITLWWWLLPNPSSRGKPFPPFWPSPHFRQYIFSPLGESASWVYSAVLMCKCFHFDPKDRSSKNRCQSLHYCLFPSISRCCCCLETLLVVVCKIQITHNQWLTSGTRDLNMHEPENLLIFHNIQESLDTAGFMLLLYQLWLGKLTWSFLPINQKT